MNAENLGFLHERLLYLGFGEDSPLNKELEQQVARQLPDFELYTDAFFDNGETKMEVKLYFHYDPQKERYFFNKYDALLIQKDEETRSQTFYLHKGIYGFTLKEAFNLLQGRSVNKDLHSLNGDKYNSWVRLLFDEKDLHDNYKLKHTKPEIYNLERILNYYPIQELQMEDTRKALIKSLCKGNIQLVTFVFESPDRPPRIERKFIAANPKDRTLFIQALAMRARPKAEKNESMPWPEDYGPEVAAPAVESPEEEEDLDKEDIGKEADVDGSAVRTLTRTASGKRRRK
jgi:hypothetical protein